MASSGCEVRLHGFKWLHIVQVSIGNFVTIQPNAMQTNCMYLLALCIN